jgi:anti-sigma factor RsiW
LTSVAHERAEELLPWYVAGELSAEDAATVAAHLRECPTCRAEHELAVQLRGRFASVSAAQPRREVLDRTLARIVRHERHRPWWRAVWRLPEARPLLALAAAQAVAIVILASAVAFGPAEFVVLGAPAERDGAVLQIVFAPDATEASLRALLQNADATIVDGPHASGLYRIRLTADAEPSHVLARLRQDPLVLFVEAEP